MRRPAVSGLARGAVRSLVVDPASRETLYAGTESGIFKSTSSGASWTPINSGLTSVSIVSLAIDPSSKLYACTPGGLWRSTNGGVSWSVLNPEISSGALAVDKASGLYAGSRGAVLRSSDGGKTWTAMPLRADGRPTGH